MDELVMSFAANDFLDRVRSAWTADTSVDPETWNPSRPSTGQCAVTALLVQDHFAGELLRSTVCGVSHYWNRLPRGYELDLTRDQFDVFMLDEPAVVREREYVLSNPDTARRYALLCSMVYP